MSNDFQINTAIHMNSFNNSIREFNKAFNSANQNSAQIQDGTNFNEIFNSISQNPLHGNVSMTNSLDLKENMKSKASPIQNIAGKYGNGLLNSLSELSQINKQAESDFETFASGGDISVHDVMISAQKSQLAMSMAIQLRNQAMNAYNEFKNMGV